MMYKTPLGMCRKGAIGQIDLRNYAWKSYCDARFSIPVAA